MPDVRPGTGSLRGYRAALILLVWVWSAIVLAANLPGHLTSDSLIQIIEGRAGLVESFNPLFGSWVFGGLTEWTGGTEIHVLLLTLLLAGAVVALLWRLPGSFWGALAGLATAAVLLFSPILLTYPGIIWKDVWFAHCCLLAFGLIALRQGGAGWWAEVAALALLAAGMLSRQTGLLVALVAVLSLTLLAGRLQATGEGRVPMHRPVLGFVARVVVLFMMASALNTAARTTMREVQRDSVGTGVMLVAMFDMAGMLQRLPGVELQRMRSEGFQTAEWEAAARTTFSAERIDRMDLRPFRGDRTLEAGTLLRQWAALVLDHPGTYLAHRLHTFAWFGGLEDQSRCLPVHVGIEPPDLAAKAGIRATPSRWSPVLYAYSRTLVDTPYFAPLAWSGVSLLVLFLLAWRRRWDDPVLWLQVAGLLYSASYLPAGLSCDFRYSYFSVAAATLGLIRMVLDGLPLPRSQHA